MRRVRAIAPLVACALCVAPSRARAHAGAPVAPHDLARAWTLDPWPLALIVISALAYGRGLRALRARVGPARGIAPWRTRAFAAGLAALVVALVSPLHAVGEALFAAHMTQHLFLTLVAAPLLVAGEPETAMLWAFAPARRRTIGRAWRHAPVLRATWRALALPATAWTLHLLALLAWHRPALYEAAVRRDAVHALEHASFLLTALLFWRPLLASRMRARLGFGAALLYLFGAAMASTLLGAFITVAREPWYRVHARSAVAWGLTALEDQQLAGLVMWVPAGLVYLGVAVWLILGALRERGGGLTAAVQACQTARV